MMFPSIGLITAALTFSTHSGNDFKAANFYIYYEDFRVNIPSDLNENEKEWHKTLKLLIVDNKAISPHMWQQMSRLNTATYLHDQLLNLPDEFRRPIDQVLFGKKIIPIN